MNALSQRQKRRANAQRQATEMKLEIKLEQEDDQLRKSFMMEMMQIFPRSKDT